MHKMHQQIQLISRVLVIIVVFFFFPVATSCAGKKCPAVTQNSDSMAVLISEDKWEKKYEGCCSIDERQ